VGIKNQKHSFSCCLCGSKPLIPQTGEVEDGAAGKGPRGVEQLHRAPAQIPAPRWGVSGQTSPPPWNPATLSETLCETGGLFVHAPSGTIGTRLFFYPGGIRGSPNPSGGERLLRGGKPLSVKNKKKHVTPVPAPHSGRGWIGGWTAGSCSPPAEHRPPPAG